MMTKSPYEILGISENASADEIKKAYRKKARENHPDTNPNDPEAAKRMNEINEAYDRIINPEKYVRQDARRSGGSPYAGGTGYQGSSSPGSGYGGGGYSSGGPGWNTGSPGGGNPYGWPFDDIFGGAWTTVGSADIKPEVSIGDSVDVQRAINSINSRQHTYAVEILSAIPSTGRNARWYYLSAIAHNGAGNTLTALEQIGKAVRMDPNNQDYRQAQQAFQRSGQTYQQESTERGFTMGGIDPGMICCGLCAAQYCARLYCVGG